MYIKGHLSVPEGTSVADNNWGWENRNNVLNQIHHQKNRQTTKDILQCPLLFGKRINANTWMNDYCYIPIGG